MRPDDANTRLGNWGERIVRDWFQRDGWYVIPAYAIEDGGAPKLTGLVKEHVLPDLQTARPGDGMRWVEVKTKTSPAHYQKAGSWRQGIDWHKWLAYLTVETITGLPGDLAIIQLKPGPEAPLSPLLLVASFAELRLGVQEVNKPRYHVAVWDVNEFEPYPLNPDGLNVPDLPSMRTVFHPWDRVSADGAAPQMSPYKQEILHWGSPDIDEPDSDDGDTLFTSGDPS